MCFELYKWYLQKRNFGFRSVYVCVYHRPSRKYLAFRSHPFWVFFFSIKRCFSKSEVSVMFSLYLLDASTNAEPIKQWVSQMRQEKLLNTKKQKTKQKQQQQKTPSPHFKSLIEAWLVVSMWIWGWNLNQILDAMYWHTAIEWNQKIVKSAQDDSKTAFSYWDLQNANVEEIMNLCQNVN